VASFHGSGTFTAARLLCMLLAVLPMGGGTAVHICASEPGRFRDGSQSSRSGADRLGRRLMFVPPKVSSESLLGGANVAHTSAPRWSTVRQASALRLWPSASRQSRPATEQQIIPPSLPGCVNVFTTLLSLHVLEVLPSPTVATRWSLDSSAAPPRPRSSKLRTRLGNHPFRFAQLRPEVANPPPDP